MPQLTDEQLNEMAARYMQSPPTQQGSGGSQFDAPVSFPQTNYAKQIMQARQNPGGMFGRLANTLSGLQTLFGGTQQQRSGGDTGGGGALIGFDIGAGTPDKANPTSAIYAPPSSSGVSGGGALIGYDIGAGTPDTANPTSSLYSAPSAPQRMYSPSVDAYYVQHPDGSIVPEEEEQE